MNLEPLRGLLVDAAVAGIAPRLDAAIWHGSALHAVSSSQESAAVFDLASLTKPLASGLLALGLVADGKLDLDAPGRDGITARQLLDHSAGYAEWLPLFRACLDDARARRIFEQEWSLEIAAEAFGRSRELVWQALEQVHPVTAPGQQTLYSDLGFLELQRRLEAAGGDRIDALFQARVAKPLGLELRFVDLTRESGEALQAVPTGKLRPRWPAPGQENALQGIRHTSMVFAPGQVDDDNAFALGGVAGQAGLFGSAAAVALAGARFLEECEGAARLAPAALAQEFCGPSGPSEQTSRGLSWDRPSGASSLGTLLGRGPLGAVGHMGFAGTSLWIDRDQRLVVALLTNRVLLGRENQQIRALRRRFHDAVARTFVL